MKFFLFFLITLHAQAHIISNTLIDAIKAFSPKTAKTLTIMNERQGFDHITTMRHMYWFAKNKNPPESRHITTVRQRLLAREDTQLYLQLFVNMEKNLELSLLNVSLRYSNISAKEIAESKRILMKAVKDKMSKYGANNDDLSILFLMSKNIDKENFSEDGVKIIKELLDEYPELLDSSMVRNLFPSNLWRSLYSFDAIRYHYAI